MIEQECPICKTLTAKVKSVDSLEQEILIDCQTCGAFSLTDLAFSAVKQKIQKKNIFSAVLGYYIRRMQTQNTAPPKITEKLIEEFFNRKLPSTADQADNLILWVGDQTEAGETLVINADKQYASVGTNFDYGMHYLVRGLQDNGLLVKTQGKLAACLTFRGWTKYQELKKGLANNKRAFMAMPFGDSKVDRVYTVFKGAVKSSGFDLLRLDEQPKAGLIDNRLRVEIQTSRFVVVDLTNGNRGAYWEGGFAEGLGKPVFYTCEQGYFTDKDKGTHFDANHLYTVLWEVGDLDKAAAELKAAIRTTLPDEAKMTDE
jgi:hypothetical protein